MIVPIPIAIALPDLAGGGAQRVMLTLAGGLDPACYRVHLIVLGGSQAFVGSIPAGIDTHIGTAPRLRSGLPWLIRTLTAIRPAIVISVMGYLNLALLGARPLLPRGTRIIVREANTVASTTTALPAWMPARRLYQQLYPTADAIVSPTPTISDEIATLAPKAAARIRVIANPVDTDSIRVRAAQPQRIPGAGLRLVAAGRLTHQKGFDRLVALLAELPPASRVDVFGTGTEAAALQAQAQASGHADKIVFRGFTADLPAWVAGADAFLLPSRWEGLPNVVLESLAVGTPVIASPEAGVAEVACELAPGALTVTPVESGFARAITSLASLSEPWPIPRPSLLPACYLKPAVIAEWSALLDRLALERAAA